MKNFDDGDQMYFSMARIGGKHKGVLAQRFVCEKILCLATKKQRVEVLGENGVAS